MILLLLPALSGCQTTCESQSPGPARDACFHERVRKDPNALTVDQLVASVTAIEDPILRGATVQVWASAHRGATSDADRRRVCGLLTGIEAMACERRLGTAHLAQ